MAQAEADLLTADKQRQAEHERWIGEMTLKREEIASRERIEMLKIKADLEKSAMQQDAAIKAAEMRPRDRGLA